MDTEALSAIGVAIWASRVRLAKAVLAHVVPDQSEAAYARSDLLERRRELMERWGSYIG